MFSTFQYMQPGERLSLLFFAVIIIGRIACSKGGSKGGN